MRVRSDINSISKLGVIFFLLPQMKLNEGAWVAIDYTPAPFVRYIFGTSIDYDKEMKIEAKNIRNGIGFWIDNDMGDLVITIRKEKFEKYFFEYINFKDTTPSDLPIPLVKRIKNGKTIYIDLDHPEEYYTINQIGDLLVIDKNGIVVTYKKLSR